MNVAESDEKVEAFKDLGHDFDGLLGGEKMAFFDEASEIAIAEFHDNVIVALSLEYVFESDDVIGFEVVGEFDLGFEGVEFILIIGYYYDEEGYVFFC